MPRKPCRVGDLEFDALVLGSHEMSADVTDHQVEKGAPITDHVVIKPARLRLEVVVGSAPTDAQQELAFPEGERWQAAFDRLVAYFEAKAELPVVLGRKSYSSMVISSISSPEGGDSFRATIELKQVTYATVARATVTLPRNSRGNRLQKTGKVSTEKPTDSQDGQARKSILLRFTQSLGAFQQ